MSTALELRELAVAYGRQTVVSGINLELAPGDIGCFLGPSGCGKTTLLRAIAGFEPPVAGEIWISAAPASRPGWVVPPERRSVGMVFQDLALFPHLTVEQNIAFGLRAMGRSDREQRVSELLALLDLEDQRGRYPHLLSGGQQQRVAVARAMAPRPTLLLLDEPFSSIDVELREQLASEVRRVLKQGGITAVMVSHNQHEAFAMADRVGVIRDGRLLQWDTPYNLYHRPACRYVADFVGEGVLIAGTVTADGRVQTELGPISGRLDPAFGVGTWVDVLIRPDDILHDDSSPLTAVVLDKAFRGAEFLYTLALASGTRVQSLVPSHHDHRLNSPIGIRLEIDHLVVFPR